MKPKRTLFPVLAASMTVVLSPMLYGGTLWDGGGTDDLFGTGANWDPDGAPPTGNSVDLTFAGTTRLTPFNNYGAFDDFRDIDFAPGAGAFTLSGNAIDLFGRIESQSINLQTVSLTLAISGGQPRTGEFNPVAGNLLINGSDIFTNGNTLQIWGDNGHTVSFDTVISQGGGISLNQNSNVVLLGTNTYSGATTINAGSLAVGNGGTAGQLGGGAVTIGGGSILTFNRSDNHTVANAFSGDGSVVHAGSGMLTFSTRKSHTGGTLVSGGILDITGGGGEMGALRGHVAVGPGGTLRLSTGDATGWGTSADRVSSLAIDGGTLHINTAVNQTFSNMAITMTGGTISGIAGSTFDFFNGGTSLTTLASADTAIVSTNSRLRQTETVVTVANGAAETDLLWSGTINQEGAGRNLTKAGDGRMNLTGVGQHSGTTTVAGGILRVGNTLRNTSGVQVGPGATLETAATNIFTNGHGTGMAASRVIELNGATWLMASGDSRLGNVTLNNGSTWTSNVNSAWGVLLGNVAEGGAASVTVTGSGASTMNGTGALRLQGVQNFNVADTTASPDTDLTVSLILQASGNAGGAAGGIHKSGAGTMLLSNLGNNFNGNIVISEGSLVTGTAQSNGTTGYLGATVTGRTITVNSGGTLDFRANNIFGGGGKNAGNIPSIMLDGGTLTSTRFNIVGNLTMNAGTLTQSATDSGSYQGYQFIGGVTVGGSAASVISTGNGKANHLLGNATTLFTVADATGDTDADLIVSAPLANGSGDYQGIGSLEKAGEGTMRLEGANTYSGTTTVSGGTLALGAAGSIASSSQIIVGASTTLDVSAVSGGWTVGSDQTLRGEGTVVGNTIILGTLSGGSSAGDIAITGDLDLRAGSIWLVEIGGTDPVDFDRLFVSGVLAAGGTIAVAFIDGFTANAGDSFQVATFGSFTDEGYSFDFSAASLDGGLQWDTSDFGSSGTIAVIPEPSGALLACLALCGMALRRRR